MSIKQRYQDLSGETVFDVETIVHFSPDEWPEGVLPWLSGSVISAVDDVREELPTDYALYPSPLFEAHVRHEAPGSQHSTNHRSRFSLATDLFAKSWVHAFEAWHRAIKHPHIGGIGLYRGAVFQGAERPMIHFDLRDDPLLWVAVKRDDGVWDYVYHVNEPVRFHRELSRVTL